MLSLKNVSRTFGGLQAVSGVNMSLGEREIVGLIGPNGAGKTTLINCMSGLDHATGGQILLGGQAIEKLPPHRIAGLGLARTYQNIRLFAEMTALENVLIAQHQQGRSTLLHSLALLPSHRREEAAQRKQAYELLRRFELHPLADYPAGSLPYGDQRRLEMARALATRPQLLLLDEPTAGMNPTETAAFGEQILQVRGEGLSVLVIEHDMSLIGQVCDRVYVLNFGQILAEGSPEQVKHNRAVIEAYLGEEESEGGA
jgi:branched-chain amino acid transport system ATP-binding protein